MSKGLSGEESSNITGVLHKTQEVDTNKNKLAALEVEAKELELKSARLRLLEQEANLQDIQERLAERQLKRETKQSRSIINGHTLRQLADTDKAVQARCNHHKGGDGAQGVVYGQGQDPQYAVLKHIMSNGDTWVRCLRCGKTWKPPIRDARNYDGTPRYKTEEVYIEAFIEYKTACAFPTRNHTSSSGQFKWSDNGEYFREMMDQVTLR